MKDDTNLVVIFYSKYCVLHNKQRNLLLYELTETISHLYTRQNATYVFINLKMIYSIFNLRHYGLCNSFFDRYCNFTIYSYNCSTPSDYLRLVNNCTENVYFSTLIIVLLKTDIIMKFYFLPIIGNRIFESNVEKKKKIIM